MIIFMRLVEIMGKQRKRERPAGLSVAEISRILELCEQRVYQLQTAGLRKLKKGLEARGYHIEQLLDLPPWSNIFSGLEMSEKLPAKVIKISPSSKGQSEQQVIAEAVIGTPIQASMTMSAYLEAPFNDCLNELVGQLHRQVLAVNKGDLRNAEGLLVAQAHSLDAIYNRLARWAMNQEDIGHFATLLKLGLRAQSQSARTLEVLSGLKNPANGPL